MERRRMEQCIHVVINFEKGNRFVLVLYDNVIIY